METSQFAEIIAKSEKIKWSNKDITILVTGKLRDIVKEKGYSSTHSKKSRAYMHNRVFVSEKDGMFIGYKMSGYQKEPWFDSVSFHFYEVKTSGGIVYVQPPPTDNNAGYVSHTCFSSHVFDRFGERVVGHHKGNRKKNIKQLLSEMLANGFVEDTRKTESAQRNGKGPLVVYTKSGMLLGEYQLMTTADGKRTESVILYKTFVSFDKARTGQEISRMSELKKIAAKVESGTKLDFAEDLYLRNYIDEEMKKQKTNEQDIND